MQRLESFRCLVLTVWLVYISSWSHVVVAQNTTGATIDPLEGGALNSIFAAWGIEAPKGWNTSGELCSGVAIEDAVTVDSEAYSPLIKCNCTFLNSTVCHVTALKVYKSDVKGSIPPELWTLEHLTYLNLSKNYLTGFLPPAISNLTRLKWLTFGINSLSGSVPPELGLLTDLISLSLSSNEFSGSIPAEIGNCKKLESLYLDSSGLSGEIPLSLANLVHLQEAWITDMEVTGQIPDFVGNWTKLRILKIFGTALSGPIPSSFANLTSLTELRLGDISNGSSPLDFIKAMKSLSILVLRNSNLTGTIPSDFGEYVNLLQVDLSFNKLTGPIPASLFNLSRLTHLFLGNNTLNGLLPSYKSPSLISVDVSYNNLSGILPSWVGLPDFTLNPVANNFELKDQNTSNMRGLDCLQKNFRCNKGTGEYYRFSVNCGGLEMNDGTELYESDDKAYGPASFGVSDAQKWAVSSVGIFAGSSSNIYKASSTADFQSSKANLFKSARLSASSLRYYGLGLQSGNYKVTLEFAELLLSDVRGKRRFDIYIQGRLVEKDFDIRKSASESSTTYFRDSSYNASVSESYLEIHLFWAGKGTCCSPHQGAYGISVSAISVTPNFKPTERKEKDKTSTSTRTRTLVGVISGVGILIILAGVVIFIFQRRRKRYTDDEELLAMDVKPFTFTYSELKKATQDFDPSNKLGEGGFGSVYKGKINDGRMVAVKQLSVASRQGKGQFVAEIATISAVQHRNLVKLYGCCFEGDHRLLVYEYLPNGSLDQALFGDKTLHLDWSTRYEICLGVARGLVYLHEEARTRIVHRDVKASNILLDSTLVPKISDFGLAKLYDDKKTHMSTRVAGTIGYLAPEYAMRGHLTEKADVYAFGVVALELVSGRSNSDDKLENEKRYLLEWAWSLHEKGREVELIDGELSEVKMEEVKRVVGIALLCTQTNHALRPPMSRVLVMLSGDVEVNDVTSKPGYLSDWRFDDTTTSSLTGFQTKDAGASESEISPTVTVSKPMFEVSIKEGR